MFTVLKRAFTSNLQTVKPSPREQAILDARGIRNPTVQAYYAWRYSLMVVVVIAALLSSGLSKYRDLYEEDRPDPVKLLLKQYSKNLTSQNLTPAAPLAQKISEKIEAEVEAGNLPEAAIAEPTEPSASDESPEASDQEPKSTGDRIDEIVDQVAMYILAVAAILVIAFWTRFGFTYRILIGAFAFSFVAPILLSLCPWSWWDGEPGTDPATLTPLLKAERLKDGMIEALNYMAMLLPTLLSLLPGVQKACVKVKTLLPQSTLPGWFLIAAAPFYGLFLLVVFVAINQVFSHPMTLAGMLLILSSSMIFAIRMDVFTRPLVSDADYRQMFRVQKTAGAMTMVAGILFLIYLRTHDVMGIYLLGLDPKNSILLPLDIAEFVLEIIGRSMFMTVFGADLFMRINLRAWKNEQQFGNSESAKSYDDVMAALEQAP